MNLFGLNIGGKAKQQPPAELPFPISTAIQGIPQAYYPETSFQSLVNAGIKRNSLVYRALMAKAGAFASAPLRVYGKDDSEQPNSPLQLMLNRPNAWQSGYEFRECIALSLDLTGNSFIYKWRNKGNGVAQLVPLRSDRISLLVSSNNGLVGYLYSIGGRETMIERGDIVHVKLGNPEELWFGFPPIQAALTKIATDNEATDFSKAILQNRAVPGLAVTIKSQTLSKEQIALVKAQMKQGYTGENRGKTMVLGEGMDVKKISLDLQELDFGTMTDSTARRILMAFGVPPQLVGLASETFNNAAEARLSFYQDTIEPLWNRVDDWFDADLVPEFGGNLRTRFDSSEVAAFESIRTAKLDLTYKGVSAGTVTVNEARVAAGFPPIQNGDVFLRSMLQAEIEAVPIVVRGRKGHEHAHSHEVKAASLSGRQRAAIMRRDAIAKLQPQFVKLASAEFKTEIEEIMGLIGKAASGAEFKTQITDPGMMRDRWRDRLIKDFQQSIEAAWLQSAQMGLSELGTDLIGIDFNLANDAVRKFASEYTYKFAGKVADTSVDEVRALMTRAAEEAWSRDQIAEAVGQLSSSWGSVRSQMIALSETMRASAHGAAAGWQQAGVIQKEWLTTPDDVTCDYCWSMNGKIVGTMANFVEKDGVIDPGVEGVPPLKVTYDAVGGADAHPYCRCAIMPVLEGL